MTQHEDQSWNAGQSDERSRLKALVTHGQALIAQANQCCHELDELWAARKDAVAQARSAAEILSPAAQVRCVLVVDDEAAVRGLLETLLSHMGFGCQTAATAAEALGCFDRARFDFVITDLHMPDMDGIALAEEIKSRKPGLPVLLITGNRLPRSSPAIDQVLLKPFSKDQLKEAIAVLPSGS
jgi:CheY-like chemotaxis protein